MIKHPDGSQSGQKPTKATHPILGRKFFCYDCFNEGKGATWTYFPRIHRRWKHE